MEANEKAGAEHRTPTVAFTVEELSIGGAEHMLLTMANAFLERGWNVHMICLSKAGELASHLNEGVQLHVLNKSLGIDLRLPVRLNRCINDIQPDVINSHLWVANSWTRLSLIFRKIPIVATEHSRDVWKPIHFRWVDRLLALRMFRMVTVSEDTASFYVDDIGIKRSLIEVINNGVDTKHYAAGDGTSLRSEWLKEDSTEASDNNRQPFLVGTVGRLVSAKNHRRLIDAIHKLINDPVIAEQHNVHLVIVGEGPERVRIQNYIVELGLSDRVTLAGLRHDISDVLAAFDIFALSSDREGHPLTALEAQSAGTPVVLTDAGGSAEAIARHAEQCGGTLVDTNVESMYAALRELIVDPVKRASYSTFAQQFALENFDEQQMIDRYEAIFHNAIAKR